MQDDAKDASRQKRRDRHVPQAFTRRRRRNRPWHGRARSDVCFGLVARRRLASWLARWRLGLGRPALLRRLRRLLWLPALGRDPVGSAAPLGVLIGPPRR